MRDLIAIEKRSPQERLIIAKTLIESVLDELPSVQPTQTNTPNALESLDCISRRAAIEVIDAVFPVDPMKSEYAQGIACGAALAKTYIGQLPSAQLTEASCWGCNCPKMERLKEQKTFSEMVHLHDAERRPT